MEQKQAYKALFAILLVTVLSVAGIALPYPILAPIFMDPVHNSLNHFTGIEGKVLLAFVLSIYPLGMLVGSSFIGTLSDHYGRKRTLLISSLMSCIGYGLSAWAVFTLNFPMLLVSRFFTGMCEGNLAIGRAIATDLHPIIDKTRSFSWLYAVTYSGWLIGPIIGGYAMFWGAWAAFVIAGLSTVLACIAIQCWVPETDNKSNNPESAFLDIIRLSAQQNSFLLLRDKQILHIFIMYLFLTLGLNGFYQFYPVWLVEDFNYSSVEIAWSSALQTVAMISVTLFVVEKLKKRFGIENTIFLGLSMLISGLAFIYLLTENMMTVYFLYTGAAIATYNGLVPVLISDKFSGEQQGRLMGLLISTFSLAAFLYAPIGGLISLLGAKLSIVLGAALLMAGSIYLKWILTSGNLSTVDVKTA